MREIVKGKSPRQASHRQCRVEMSEELRTGKRETRENREPGTGKRYYIHIKEKPRAITIEFPKCCLLFSGTQEIGCPLLKCNQIGVEAEAEAEAGDDAVADAVAEL